MRTVHLSVFRELSEGQRKQLKFEAGAATQLQHDTWDVIALHAGLPIESFERRIPFPFRPIFLRALYAWLLMLQLSRRYDVVLCRHMTFDPFALLFSWFVRNRATVHHAKEIQELLLIRPGLPGRLASWLERHAGAVAVKTAAAIIGVTDDIRRYELAVRDVNKPSHVYPNGINFTEFQALADERSPTFVNAAFICERFAPWHGLDLLIEAARPRKASQQQPRMKIHLIGRLSDAQIDQVRASNDIDDIFVMHGLLQTHEYEQVLAACDIGIGSLAMFREGLQEGATLKVREYLAMGLPVFSGHKDTAIPDDFEFYTNDECTIEKMLDFGLRSKAASRESVRTLSRPYVDKGMILHKTQDWLADAIVNDAPAEQVTQ